MSGLKIRFGLGWLILAVALTAINIPLVLDCLKRYPRRSTLATISGGRGALYINKEDGSYYIGSSRTPGRPPRLVHGPTRPSHLRIWSPIIASATASLVVLFLFSRLRRGKS